MTAAARPAPTSPPPLRERPPIRPEGESATGWKVVDLNDLLRRDAPNRRAPRWRGY